MVNGEIVIGKLLMENGEIVNGKWLMVKRKWLDRVIVASLYSNFQLQPENNKLKIKWV